MHGRFMTLIAVAISAWSAGLHRDLAAQERVVKSAATCAAADADILFQQADSSGSSRDLDIYAIRADGSMLRRLTDSPGFDGDARWSPDGRRIVFTSARAAKPEQRAGTSLQGAAGYEIYVMNADGTGVQRLTTNDYYEGSPTWSPDGRRIAFVATPDARPDDSTEVWASRRQIFVMNLDGSALQQLTSSRGGNNFPDWSPDGHRIAFSSQRDSVGGAQVYVMSADGSSQRRLTHSSVEETFPIWSPDGQRIAFISKAQDSLSDVHTMRPDGSDVVNVTRSSGFDGFPSWSPDRRCMVYAHHLTPGSASTLLVRSIDGAGESVSLGVSGTRPAWRPARR